MRRVICVYLPTWPTDRLRKNLAKTEPGSLEMPLLTASREGSRRVVQAVDARAAALGLRPGMAVAQAQALQPDLRIEPADPAADAAGLRRLAAWCIHHWSPLAAPCPPDSLWIDATGCAHLHGGESAMLRAIATRLVQAGFAARAAMAATPGAAHAFAHHGAPPLYVAEPDARPVLKKMPVAALRLEPETVAGLARLGLTTIGDLAATPRAPLTKRFGAVVRRLDQLWGNAPEPIEPVHAARLPRARMRFAEPIATPEAIARAAALLADSLCGKLQRLGLGAWRLDWVCQLLDGSALTLRVGTHAATRDATHLIRLLRDRIETIEVGLGLEQMVLTASLTGPLPAGQITSALTAAPAPDFATLADSLANRLGEGRLYHAAPLESDLPERSVARIAPLAAATGATWPSQWPRPARLFAPPWPIEVLALLPDHPPAQFTWRRARHRVCRADGPERVFGEWWDDPDETWSVRDYFQLEDEAGQRFWVFRNGDGEQTNTGNFSWFLHGLFG